MSAVRVLICFFVVLVVPVDYGPFAHFTAAPRTRDAAVSAEKSRNLNLAEFAKQSSNAHKLLDALQVFFKDNPTWK